MELTVISRQMIRPSSPTPPHLRHWQLSIIDQGSCQIFYGRTLYLYSARSDTHRFANSNMSDRLKRSLSEALTDFYPLAGIFDSNKSVDCNDAGLEYIEAQVRAPLTLTQLLAIPKTAELDALLPRDVYNYGTGFEGPSAVQVTVFDACGGMAVGVSLSHVLADGSSLALFVNAWAANARGGTAAAKAAAVPFNFASLFPPRDTLPPGLENVSRTVGLESQVPPKKLVIKRFVFTQSEIEALKEKFVHERPTRVEVVSAVMFKCLINVSRLTSSRSVVLWMMVNLRTRMTTPPPPTHYLGNMTYTPATTIQTTPTGLMPSLSELGMQLRKMIKEIDSDYVTRLQADNALLVWERLVQSMNIYSDPSMRGFTLSCICKFPFHEADLGWGSPISALPVFSNTEDVVMLLDNPDNGAGGIEAWLTLDEDDMTRFESEFRDFNAAAAAATAAGSMISSCP